MNNSIKILVSYYKPSLLIKNDIFIPIHCGRDPIDLEHKNNNFSNENYKWLINNTIADNIGENISLKNIEYSELTGMYWAWKNYEKIGNPDFFGFFNYKHLLNISDKYIDNILEFNDNINNLIGFDESNLEDILSKNDIILPYISKVHSIDLPENLMTNYAFYKYRHDVTVLDKVISTLKTKYPDYISDCDNYLQSYESFFYNIFIMKREIFFEYCDWLFDVLFSADINNNLYINREAVFIAERLLNIFILHYIRVNIDISIAYRNICYVFEKVEKFDRTKVRLGNKDLALVNKNINIENKIYIVYSADNNYIQHCCVSIASLLMNNYSSFCHFIILDGGISNSNKNKLLDLKKINDFDIDFYDMTKIDFSAFKMNREYISIATYYRLIIVDLLPEYIDRVLYLDCDTIIETDVSTLYNIDMENSLAVAVEDEGGVTQTKRLGLDINIRYFNAGVMLFNIKELRKINFKERCFEIYYNNKDIILLQDQDILNIALHKKVNFVELNWNTNSRIFLGNNLKGFNTPLIEKKYSAEDEKYAKYSPYIIHYTNQVKPWDIDSKHPLKDEYFMYLHFTPFRNFKIKYWFRKNIFYIKNNHKYFVMKFLFIILTFKRKH